MLSRGFLKRFTRLGLSAYLMTWCMSFTVCASDYPISDLNEYDSSFSTFSEDASEDELDYVPGEASENEDGETAEIPEDALVESSESSFDEDAEEALEEDTEEVEEVLEEDSILTDEGDVYGVPAYIDMFAPVESITINAHELVVTNKSETLCFNVTSYSPETADYDYTGLVYEILDKNMLRSDEGGEIIPIKEAPYYVGDGVIGLDLSDLTESIVFYVKFTYVDPDSEWMGPDMVYPSDICKVEYVAPDDEELIEAIFHDNSVDVELFKNENPLYIDILADFSEPVYLSEVIDEKEPSQESYFIKSAYFLDDTANELFEVTVEDGDLLNVRVRDDVLDSYGNATEFNKQYPQKSITTGLNLTVVSSKYEQILTLTATGNITLNLKRSTPTLKAEKLTFNPYLFEVCREGYDEFYPSISGAMIEAIRINPAATCPDGFFVEDDCLICANSSVNEKTKNGNVPILARVSDEEWNLPNDNEVAVSVPYTLKEVKSSLKLYGATPKKGIINPLVDSPDMFFYMLKVNDFDVTMINDSSVVILDSKNKDVSYYFDIWPSDFEHSNRSSVYIRFTENTSIDITETYGKTFKAVVTPYNYMNGRAGTNFTYQFTVVDVKNAGKPSISISKIVNGLDPFDPNSQTEIYYTTKNIAPTEFVSNADVKIFTSKGEDVTKYFAVYPTASNDDGCSVILEPNTYSYGMYPLISQELDGQTLKVSLRSEKYIDGKAVQVQAPNKSIKIKSGSVTPKIIGSTKSTMNPGYENTVDITYLLPNYYYSMYEDKNWIDSRIDICCGGKVLCSTTDYSSTNITEGDDIYQKCEASLCIPALLTESGVDVSTVIGKTIDIKIVPLLPSGITTRKLSGLKAATYKLTIVNPVKTLVSASAKTTGSINNVKDSTNVSITYTFKNIMDYDAILDYKFSDIYLVKGSEKVNCSSYFINDHYYVDNMANFTSLITRKAGKTPEPGTYKVDFTYMIRDKQYNPKTVTITSTFKVTRGSITLVSDKKAPELYNNNSKRTTITLSTKDKTLNAIDRVVLADTDSIFNIEDLGYGKISLGFKNGKHIETTTVKGKQMPITKAVTKTVKVNVYNVGSSKPTQYSIKVKINP